MSKGNGNGTTQVEDSELLIGGPLISAGKAVGSTTSKTTASASAPNQVVTQTLLKGTALTGNKNVSRTLGIKLTPDLVSICCIKKHVGNFFTTPLTCKLQGGSTGDIDPYAPDLSKGFQSKMEASIKPTPSTYWIRT